MKVLGIMQCMWAREPERVERVIAMERERLNVADFYRWRRAFAGRLLFVGRGLTARRLESAGLDWIEFEEAHPKVGGKAAANFGYCMEHLGQVITHYGPDIVITFGQVAASGITALSTTPSGIGAYLRSERRQIIEAPHPAARQPGTLDRLKEISANLKP